MKPVEFLKDIKVGFAFFMRMGYHRGLVEYNMTVIKVGRKYFYCTDSVHSWEHKFKLNTGEYVQQWGSQPLLFRSNQAYLDYKARVATHLKINKFFQAHNHTDALTRTQLDSILAIIGKDNV